MTSLLPIITLGVSIIIVLLPIITIITYSYVFESEQLPDAVAQLFAISRTCRTSARTVSTKITSR